MFWFLIMYDVILRAATAAGLPLVPAYKNLDNDYAHGVNFAVAGSTALSSEALANKSIISMFNWIGCPTISIPCFLIVEVRLINQIIISLIVS